MSLTKTVLTFIIFFTTVMLVSFGLAVFIFQVPNPMDWLPIGRFLLVLWGVAVFMPCAIATGCILEEASRKKRH